MNTEEKAKAYDEALEKGRIFRDHLLETGDKGIAGEIEYIFPELVESKDEKIRKALIRFHKSTIDVDGIKGDDIIVWLEKQCYTKKDVDDAYLKGIIDAKNELEKQGEQKTADKSATTKQGDEIEIPFGAKDSELQEATYYIPKDFHDEIDGDKVVIKKGEKPAAWNVEDSSKVQRICKYLDEAKKYYADITEVRECMDWLKSLKDRIEG